MSDMTLLDSIEVLPIAVALGTSLALTPIVIATARRVGMVAQPKADRWHRKPTAMLGGLAVMFATVCGFAFGRPTNMMWYVLGVSIGMCALGLVDDILHIKPYQKLVVQILGAAAVISAGLTLPWTGSITLNVLITVFWLTGITNAVNLLDNMDGLAAGVAIIASVCLGLNFLMNGQVTEATMLLAFGGALLGFLVYNFEPASVFMGDCGSLFVGFFLASSALLSSHATAGRTRSLLPVLAVPVLIFAIPIFDTTFVTLMRKLSGRAASQGGRDHTSHRLVALGMSERNAVLMLYVFAILAGSVALAARHIQLDVSLAITAIFVLALTVGGVHLAGVKVYTDDMINAPPAPVYSFLLEISYKRRIFEVLLDTILVVLAYYLSYLTLFGPFTYGQPDWMLFVETVPLIVGALMVSFLATGAYRGVWRYTSLTDLASIARGVLTGSVASLVLVGFVFRYDGFSRGVFALNAVLLFIFVAGSRLSFRLLKRRRPASAIGSRTKVLIYGAGDAGERVFRELSSNFDLPYAPVAFLDDDVRKVGRMIRGLPVLDGRGRIAEHCRALGVEEVLISSTSFTPPRINAMWAECTNCGVTLRQVALMIEAVQGVPEPIQLVTDEYLIDSTRPRRTRTDSGKHLVRTQTVDAKNSRAD